jgi:hypothetical protein
MEHDGRDRASQGGAALYSEDARYVDPLAAAQGPRRDLGAHRRGPAPVPRLHVPARPGRSTATTTCSRFRWELGPDGQEAPVVGFDTVVTDADGRIQTVLGFLDKVPVAH